VHPAAGIVFLVRKTKGIEGSSLRVGMERHQQARPGTGADVVQKGKRIGIRPQGSLDGMDAQLSQAGKRFLAAEQSPVFLQNRETQVELDAKSHGGSPRFH